MPTWVNSLMTDAATTTVSFATTVITTYWYWFLGVILVSGFVGLVFSRFGKMFTRNR